MLKQHTIPKIHQTQIYPCFLFQSLLFCVIEYKKFPEKANLHCVFLKPQDTVSIPLLLGILGVIVLNTVNYVLFEC